MYLGAIATTALLGVTQLLLPYIRKSPKMAHSRNEVLDELRSASKIFHDIDITMNKSRFTKKVLKETIPILVIAYVPFFISDFFLRITSVTTLLLSGIVGVILAVSIYLLWKKPKTKIEVQDDKFKEKISMLPPIYIRLYVKIISNQNITLTGKLSSIGRYLVIENEDAVWPIEWHNILGIGVVKSLS